MRLTSLRRQESPARGNHVCNSVRMASRRGGTSPTGLNAGSRAGRTSAWPKIRSGGEFRSSQSPSHPLSSRQATRVFGVPLGVPKPSLRPYPTLPHRHQKSRKSPTCVFRSAQVEGPIVQWKYRFNWNGRSITNRPKRAGRRSQVPRLPMGSGKTQGPMS